MEIKEKNKDVQLSGLSSNLGGPTFDLLDNREKSLNEQWAKRFIELNGGGRP